METIYLSLRAQVAVGTFFMKSPIPKMKCLGNQSLYPKTREEGSTRKIRYFWLKNVYRHLEHNADDMMNAETFADFVMIWDKDS